MIDRYSILAAPIYGVVVNLRGNCAIICIHINGVIHGLGCAVNQVVPDNGVCIISITTNINTYVVIIEPISPDFRVSIIDINPHRVVVDIAIEDPIPRDGVKIYTSGVFVDITLPDPTPRAGGYLYTRYFKTFHPYISDGYIGGINNNAHRSRANLPQGW